MWFVFILVVYHSYLIIINTTTNEQLKNMWKNPIINPFRYKNCIKNIISLVGKRKSFKDWDMGKEVDFNFEVFSIVPSKIGVNQTLSDKTNCGKSKSEGETSPYVCDVKEDYENGQELISISQKADDF